MHLGLVDRPFVPQIGIVPSFISIGTPQHATRETSISEGRKLDIRILPAARNEPQLMGSFTCPKGGTWDRLFDFPSEGRHAEDFYIRKIRRLRPGLNPRTRAVGDKVINNSHLKKVRDTMVMSNVIKIVLCLGGIPQREVIIKLLELWLLPLVLSSINTDAFNLIKTADVRYYNLATKNLW
jgi:hypothetical protein